MSDQNKIDDGGYAFPLYESHFGMTLRDYFAAAALQGMMSQAHSGPKKWTHMGHGWGEDCLNDLNCHHTTVAKTLADFAYRIADTMLEARKAKS